MAESMSRRGLDSPEEKASVPDYDQVRAIIEVAKKNGWDLESLHLIPKDLPPANRGTVTRKQVMERNRVVKRILQRFSEILTPPVPSDLERAIRGKDRSTWLPWEQEAVQRIDYWRSEIDKIRPEIVRELTRVIHRYF